MNGRLCPIQLLPWLFKYSMPNENISIIKKNRITKTLSDKEHPFIRFELRAPGSALRVPGIIKNVQKYRVRVLNWCAVEVLFQKYL